MAVEGICVPPETQLTRANDRAATLADIEAARFQVRSNGPLERRTSRSIGCKLLRPRHFLCGK